MRSRTTTPVSAPLPKRPGCGAGTCNRALNFASCSTSSLVITSGPLPTTARRVPLGRHRWVARRDEDLVRAEADHALVVRPAPCANLADRCAGPIFTRPLLLRRVRRSVAPSAFSVRSHPPCPRRRGIAVCERRHQGRDEERRQGSGEGFNIDLGGGLCVGHGAILPRAAATPLRASDALVEYSAPVPAGEGLSLIGRRRGPSAEDSASGECRPLPSALAWSRYHAGHAQRTDGEAERTA